ncbi:MAG: holo-ACP synthase [Phycisphaeraceae bacterium]|nr:holo-ACP synthase [Phycisphaeraceae bacterium]
MAIIGHGIDVVEVSRISRLMAENGEAFLERCFTVAERDYAGASRRRDEHLAARFAAKEAVMKALGTGWTAGIAWTEIEVTRDAAGVPGIRLSGAAGAAAARAGVGAWHVSLSHTDTTAIASVIAETG